MNEEKSLAFWIQARTCVTNRHHQQALEIYEELVRHYPQNPLLHYELANTARSLLEEPRAARALRAALDFSGTDADLICSIGTEYQMLGLYTQAVECFEICMELAPDSPRSAKSLITLLERVGAAERAEGFLKEFASKSGDPCLVSYLSALLAQRNGDASRAETLLRDLLHRYSESSWVRISSLYLLAKILDQQGSFSEAMHILLQAKDGIRSGQSIQEALAGYDEGIRDRNEVLYGISREEILHWQAAEPPVGCQDVRFAFLGGHPRSGTTLLEKCLSLNPQIAAFDETTAFGELVDSFLIHYGPDHPDIPKLPDRYRKSLTWASPNLTAGSVLLDKNPSLTSSLHTWLRVFPSVKIIMALRQPLDVILSTFFLDLPLNSISCNFLSLERTVRHYKDLMDVWLHLRELGGFQWMESRYEETVQNLTKEGRRVTEFLGLPWVEKQAETLAAPLDVTIRAPSYHDTRQPIHSKSINRWRSYEEHLQPFSAELKPYFERLGY